MSLTSLFLWLALLGIPFVYGDDGEKFSLDSDDSEDSDGSKDSASEQSYNGFGFRVYEENGVPELIVYNDNDEDESVYCLSFTESFEASEYNTSDDYTKVPGSTIDFSTLTWEYNKCNSTAGEDCLYTVSTSDSGKFDSLKFTLQTQTSTNSEGETEYSVKFDIDLTGYGWEDESEDYLVFVFPLDDCSDEYDTSGSKSTSSGSKSSGSKTSGSKTSSSKSGSGSGSDDRRRMHSGSGSGSGSGDDDDDEDDNGSSDIGISSDDSNEFDLNKAYFVISPTADGDGGSGNVDARLFYQTVDSETSLHIVYSHFNSNLTQDPLLGVDSDKINSNGGNINQISGVAMVMSLFVAIVGYIVSN